MSSCWGSGEGWCAGANWYVGEECQQTCVSVCDEFALDVCAVSVEVWIAARAFGDSIEIKLHQQFVNHDSCVCRAPIRPSHGLRRLAPGGV